MKSIKFIIIIFLSSTFYLSSCKKDKTKPGGGDDHHHEEELITTVQVIVQDSLSNELDTFAFRDIDGVGGIAPTIDTLFLDSNSTYFVDLRFLDESDPIDVEDITSEIEMEDDEHIICFDLGNIQGMHIQRTDSDGTYEVGLKSKWVLAPSASSNNGMVSIQLKHQPEVKNGTCEPGDTDVLVEFPTVIN